MFLIRNRLGITRATFRNDFPLATFVAKCLRNLTAQRASCLVRFKHGPFSKHRIDLGENRSLDRIGIGWYYESKLNMDISNIGDRNNARFFVSCKLLKFQIFRNKIKLYIKLYKRDQNRA